MGALLNELLRSSFYFSVFLDKDYATVRTFYKYTFLSINVTVVGGSASVVYAQYLATSTVCYLTF